MVRLVALALVLAVTGCASYKFQIGDASAEITSMRKLDRARVKVTPDGGLDVDLNGVDTPTLPQYIPFPVPPVPMKYNDPDIRSDF